MKNINDKKNKISERYKLNDEGKYEFAVLNHIPTKTDDMLVIDTTFDELESVINKIELDLMTYSHYGDTRGYIVIELREK